MQPIKVIMLCLFLFSSIDQYAQYQNIWAFGVNSGLDFNKIGTNGYPQSIRTKIRTKEGVATICDKDGNLLFYTDGSFIYNKDYEQMPNGFLFPTAGRSITHSTTQGTIIIPKYSTNQYYIFSLSCVEESNYRYNSKLYYSVVDMSLDNGKGDVVPTQKSIFIDSLFSEQLINVVGDDCKKWVVLGKYGNDRGEDYSIVFYQVYEDSISTQPIVNKIPDSLNFPYLTGGMMVSHDFRYLVDCRDKATIYELDPINSKVSNPIVIARDNYTQAYYACFSPDNTKLYLTCRTNDAGYNIIQVDLTNYDEMSINQSYFPVTRGGNGFFGMQLGPDGRIYVSMPTGEWTGGRIHVINNPNESKEACNFDPTINFLKIPSTTPPQLGLPNNFRLNNMCEVGKKYDSCYFTDNRIGVYKENLKTPYFKWNTGDTAQFIVVDTPGIYLVEYILGSIITNDTFIVRTTKRLSIGSSNNTADCFNSGYSIFYLQREANDSSAYRTTWINSNQDTVHREMDTIMLTEPGDYLLLAELNNCIQEFPFRVEKKVFGEVEIIINSTYNCITEPTRAYASFLLPSVNLDTIAHEVYWLTASMDTLSLSDTAYELPSSSYYLLFKTITCDTLIPFNIITEGESIDFTYDSIVCQNQMISVENTSADYYTDFHWYLNEEFLSESSHHNFSITHAGTYTLTLLAEGNICKDTLSKTITVDSQYTGEFYVFPDSICAGEAVTFYSINDISTTQFQWQIGKHQMTMHQHENFNHAFAEPGIFPINLTTNYRICPEATFTAHVHVYPTPKVYLGSDSSICYQGNSITLQNLANQPTNTSYYWSTGDTTRTLQVTTPGSYSLKLTENTLGCTGYGSVEITKDCFVDIPNAFTPNGDGVNDYFFPRKWLSKGVKKMHLQIFNRWGQLIYETSQTDGLGWDGKWNGVDQSTGAYIYRISVAFKNGAQESYEGNVTILR